MAKTRVLDAGQEMTALAEHLPHLAIIVVEHLGYAYVIDPATAEIYLEDTTADRLTERMRTAIHRLADHIGVSLDATPQLRLVAGGV